MVSAYREKGETVQKKKRPRQGEANKAQRQELVQYLVEQAKQQGYLLVTPETPKLATDNFRHWCKRATWTLDQAVALSLGKNPKLVNWKTVSPFTQVSTFAKEYDDRRDIANCAFEVKQLFDPVYPSIFLAWAKKKFDPLPAELLQAALDDGISLAGWKELYEGVVNTSKQHLTNQAAQNQKHVEDIAQFYKLKLEEVYAELKTARLEAQNLKLKAEAEAAVWEDKPLFTRERENLQLMAVFGAIRGYGYNPDAKRNTASIAISQDFSDQRLALTDDAVRDHLNAGKEFLPGDWRTRLKAKPYTGKL